MMEYSYMYKIFALLTSLFVFTVAQAQTTTPSGVMVYGDLNIVNTTINSATGLTNGMSNGSVREMLYEFDDATLTLNAVTNALTAHMVETGPSSGDKVALIANIYNCCLSSSGFILGLDAVAMGDVGSSQVVLAGAQVEVNSQGVQRRRYGVEITVDPKSTTQGTEMDAAIAIDSLGNPGSPWSNAITIGDPEGSIVPLGGGANMFHIYSPMGIANFCDCSNLTMSQYIFDFGSPYQVTGGGIVKAQGFVARGQVGANCPAGSFNPATAVVTNGLITTCH